MFVHHKSGKLNPRGLHCIFVGYLSTQKGYWSYHPPSRKFFVSADVAFYEAECYYMQEVSSRTTLAEQEQIDLEFLRYVGSAPLCGPKITLENEVDIDSGVNQHDEGLMSQPLSKEDEELEEKDNQNGIEPEDDQERPSKILEVATSEPQVATVDEDLVWPIALRKEIPSYRTNVKHPIGHYVRCEKLGNQYINFLEREARIQKVKEKVIFPLVKTTIYTV